MRTLALEQNFWELPTIPAFPAGKLSLPVLRKPADVADSLSVTQLTYQLFLEAACPDERLTLLDELLARHVAPLVQTIVRKKLRACDADDACELQQQIQLKVLARLRSDNEAPLQDFAGYVAVAAYHACADWQRQRQPLRHALKNRLRYMLTHTAGLALWETQSRIWCAGRTEWQTRRPVANSEQLEALRYALPHSTQLRELADALFTRLDQPVELDDLVNLFAEILGIHDQSVTLADAHPTMELADARPSAEAVFERRAYLQKLWAEICALPLPQRCALLLNLRDTEGGSQLALFHLTGIAGFRQIAEALALPLDEFLALWNQLPLDDLSLAARLGITRQQVINLRLAARRRLARHLGQA